MLIIKYSISVTKSANVLKFRQRIRMSWAIEFQKFG